MNIATLTKDCPREDCRLQYRGSSTTLLGWLPTYDKKGNQIGRDPNTTTSSYNCLTCGVSWRVKSREDNEDVIERFGPKPQITSVT